MWSLLTGEDDVPAAPSGSEPSAGWDRIRLVGIRSTDDDEDDLGMPCHAAFRPPQRARGIPSATRAAPPSPPRRHRRRRRGRPWLVGRRPSAPGWKRCSSTPFPSNTSFWLGTPRRASTARSSGFWTSSAPEHREARAFEGVHHGPAAEPILRAGVEAVHGVDDARHPGRPGGDSSVDARFGVVGVDDVGPQSSEEPPQFDKRHDVLADRNGPRGMAQGLVADAP